MSNGNLSNNSRLSYKFCQLLQLFNKQLLTAGIQLERKVKQLELNLKKESDGRRKDKIIHDEEMKRLRSSVHLIR